MRINGLLFTIIMLCLGAVGVGALSQAGIVQLPWEDRIPGHAIDRGVEPLYGPIYLKPDRYSAKLLKDKRVRTIPIGPSTFGELLPKQARYSIEGAGPIPGRPISADTQKAADLLTGRSEQRTTTFLRGFQRLLDERDGYVKGISLSSDRWGYVANTFVIFVEINLFNWIGEGADMKLIGDILVDISREVSDHSAAWYQFDSSRIVMGPQVTRMLERYFQNPNRLTPQEGITVAYVMRHEIEHSVTPINDWESSPNRQFWEEGTADVLASWAGVPAQTAKELGLPYPKKAVDRRYRNWSFQVGYPPYVESMELLLGLVGIDASNPRHFTSASNLLQTRPAPQMPRRLSTAIMRRHGLTQDQRAQLQRRLAKLDGRPAGTRVFVRDVRKMAASRQGAKQR